MYQLELIVGSWVYSQFQESVLKHSQYCMRRKKQYMDIPEVVVTGVVVSVVTAGTKQIMG